MSLPEDICAVCDGHGCEYCDTDHYEVDYLKLVAEGVEDLKDLVDTLRLCANFYEQRYTDGWYMTEPVVNGFVHLHRE
jgi:hypothetical protein